MPKWEGRAPCLPPGRARVRVLRARFALPQPAVIQPSESARFWLEKFPQKRLDTGTRSACDKADPLGRDRLHAYDHGAALAGSATLNRLELGNHRHDRTHKITHDPARVEATLLTLGVRCLDKHARRLIVDLDAMGHLVHGLEEGRHFSADYDGYCYLPLYAFVGDVRLWAQLRPGASDAAAGVVPALEKIIAALRRRCKKARIILRGDSAFAREEIMAWCETQPRVIYYCLAGCGATIVKRYSV